MLILFSYVLALKTCGYHSYQNTKKAEKMKSKNSRSIPFIAKAEKRTCFSKNDMDSTEANTFFFTCH